MVEADSCVREEQLCNIFGTVTAPRLYQLIRQPPPIADRQFEIEFLDAGVEAFALTFG
jgi:hypothetical protein